VAALRFATRREDAATCHTTPNLGENQAGEAKVSRTHRLPDSEAHCQMQTSKAHLIRSKKEPTAAIRRGRLAGKCLLAGGVCAVRSEDVAPPVEALEAGGCFRCAAHHGRCRADVCPWLGLGPLFFPAGLFLGQSARSSGRRVPVLGLQELEI
jgi:hypothetical protein